MIIVHYTLARTARDGCRHENSCGDRRFNNTTEVVHWLSEITKDGSTVTVVHVEDR